MKDVVLKIWGNPLVRTTVVLFLIAAISAGALSAVNLLTEEPIAQNGRQAVENALKSVFSEAVDFQSDDSFLSADSSVTHFYIAVGAGGEIIGYDVQAAPQGYGGAIDMVVGISTEGTVIGVSVIGSSETPGLGTKAGEYPFLGQFVGKRAGVTVGRGENNVDAISGATLSSRAVTAGVADGLSAVQEYMAREAAAE